jgi:hypothetical protein
MPQELIYLFVVPVKGLEPPLPLRKRILSPSRLPFRHTGISFFHKLARPKRFELLAF